MKVLVTGANGFIGSHLCAYLARRPDLEVRGLVRPAGDRSLISGIEGVTVLTGDVTQPGTLASPCRAAEVVYHVAGHSSDWGSWEAFRAGNVTGVGNVLQAARRGNVRRVVHISSVSVYGFPGGADLDEATAFTPRPGDRYVTTKAAGDRLAMSYNASGIEVVVVRPGGVYGANDRTTTMQLVPALLEGKFGFVDGGVHLMAPAYIDNVVQLIGLAGEVPGAAGEAFNAADDGRTTWRQFIGWMCEDLQIPLPRLSLSHALAWPAAVAVDACAKAIGMQHSPLINRYRIRAVMRDSHYSCAKAKRLLGYSPTVGTREGIRRTVAWYRDYASRAALHG
jgi:nucleoside-diphosphate-sugar epimerase